MSDHPETEQRNVRSYGLGGMSVHEVIALMDDEEPRTLAAVKAAAPDLEIAAQRVASTVLADGRVVLLGAGTSGRIAVQEVAELVPTFGVPVGMFTAFAAGGPTLGTAALATSEDDVEAVPRALAEMHIGPSDVVIGVASSGTTPFVLAGVRAASLAGSWTCGIANNRDTPLLAEAAHGVLLSTGAEVLTGSTRLQAGTAQKLALNRITTAAMVSCGRVVENHMIDVVVTITKLETRAVRILTDLSGLDNEAARQLLESTGWSVRDTLRRISESDGPDDGPQIGAHTTAP